FLPGQIRIGGQNLWELASDYATRSRLEFLFAEVEHLPLAFNQADSAAENKGQKIGLAAAFAAACAVLTSQSRLPRIGELSRVRDNLGAVPHPHSPAGKLFNWAAIGVPHPDAPAARGFDWPAWGPYPNSRSDFDNRFLKSRHGVATLMDVVIQGFEVWSSGAKEAL